MKRIVFCAAIIGWVGLLPLQALSDAGSSSATKEEKVQIARAAAPSFISDNATIVDVDGSVWNQFCSETVANSNGHSSNLVDVSPTESQAFCTYWWGEFSWTHGLTTNFSTSDLLTEP